MIFSSKKAIRVLFVFLIGTSIIQARQIAEEELAKASKPRMLGIALERVSGTTPGKNGRMTGIRRNLRQERGYESYETLIRRQKKIHLRSRRRLSEESQIEED